ncbi:MAG: hypothetical protein AAF960_16580 [Bacteroidota bacterium]
MRIQQTVLILFLVFIFDTAFGQISKKGIPLSMTESFLEKEILPDIPEEHLPLFDRIKLERAKAKNPNFAFEGVAVDANINLRQNGEWTLMNDGSRMWRLKITAKGATSLTLLYDDFWLPEESKFYLYTENERQILGAFTHQNNKKSGKFSTATTFGESVYLEYYEPAKVSGTPRISINKVIQQVENGRSRGEFGFGASADCHININCETGAASQDTKRGVVRIMLILQDGEDIFNGFCSGSLVNNTAEDQTPYLLTAFHCIVEGFTPLYDQWQFNFGYEAPNCDNPTLEPIFNTVVGAELVAGRQDPDFLLVKISQSIPSSFSPYFAGWNRALTALPDKATMIHHPCGDIKKITVDNQNTTSVFPRTINWAEYTSTPNTHFEIKMDEGFSQVGASGSPLFGSDGLLYGQLHGGNINIADCSIFNLYYGRLGVSWEGDTPQERLKDWLDPINSGVSSLNSLDPFVNLANFSIRLQTPKGEGIGGVNIQLEGADTTANVMTDDEGFVGLQLPRQSAYRITFRKTGEILNGVTTFDIVKIRRHILGLESFDDPFKEVAGDANLSNSVTTFDIIEIQKLILGINPQFPNAPSWGFVSPQGNLFNILTLNDLQPEVNLNILGVKIGDVNYSADPTK